jgi:acyl transferase domain-containing protein
MTQKASQEIADEFEGAMHGPIAIIGASCRFPGGVKNLQDYWNLLVEGVDAIHDIPPDRWDVDAFYDPNPDAPGKMYMRQGGFLDNVDAFDPLFFGISPREAITLDPQQRLLLEVSWEAIENAGIAASELTNTPGGVFIGIFNINYKDIIRHSEQNHDSYVTTGNLYSTAVGRLAYTLGLQGPCISIDTACSSSLVAIHEACQSLRRGECHLALAGGVNLILTPDDSIDYCKTKMLSRENRCKTFDEKADGFARG